MGEIVVMKTNNAELVRLRGILLTFIISVLCAFSPAYCQGQQVTLLVQQTPDEGGAVTPLAGTYKYEPDSDITLTALPNPGYEFAYWLGDVSDQKSISTVVHLDKPKIVIAVFQPIQSNLEVSGRISSGGGGGRAGLVSNPVTIGMPAGISGTGGGKPQQQKVYFPAGEKPPVVPEPATGVLLTLGSLFAFKKRRKSRINPARNRIRTCLS